MLRRLEKYTYEIANYHSMDYDTAAKLVVGEFALGRFKGGVVHMVERASFPTTKEGVKMIAKIGGSSKTADLRATKILAKPGARTAGKIFKVLGPISIALDVADIIYTWNSDFPGVK